MSLLAIGQNRSLVPSDGQTQFLNTMEDDMGQMMLRLIAGAAAGERHSVAPTSSSAQSVARLPATNLANYPLRQGLTVSGQGGVAAAAQFVLPTGFAAAVGLDTINVDIQTQMLASAPSPDGTALLSPLAGLSVAPAGGTRPATVANLSQPVLVTIPVTGTVIGGTPVGCVYWDGSKGGYSSAGCSVVSVAVTPGGAVTAVTCACTHLTLFAVAQLGPVNAVITSAIGTADSALGLNGTLQTFLSVTSVPVPKADTGNNLANPSATVAVASVAVGWKVSSTMQLSGTIPLASFQDLSQRATTVRGMIAASITDVLAHATVDWQPFNITVVVVKLCFAGQCIDFTANEGSRRTGGQQSLVVSFIATGSVLSSGSGSNISSTLVKSAVLNTLASDAFGQQLAIALGTHAASAGMGSWSVTVNVTQANAAVSGADSAGTPEGAQRPDFKSAGSSPTGSGGSGTSPDTWVAGNGGGNLLSLAALVGSLSGVVGILLACTCAYFFRQWRRRKSLKVQDVGGWVAAQDSLSSPEPDSALSQHSRTAWYGIEEDIACQDEEVHFGRDAGATSKLVAPSADESQMQGGDRPLRVNRARQRLESLKALMDKFEDDAAQRPACGVTSEIVAAAAEPVAGPRGERVRIVFRRPTSPVWQPPLEGAMEPSPPSTPKNAIDGSEVDATPRDSLRAAISSSAKLERQTRPRTPPTVGGSGSESAGPRLVLGSFLRQPEQEFTGPSTPKDFPTTPRWTPQSPSQALSLTPRPPPNEPPADRPAFYNNLRQPAAVSPLSGDGPTSSLVSSTGFASRRPGISVPGLALPQQQELVPRNTSGPFTPRSALYLSGKN